MLIVVEKKGEWVLGGCEETFRRNWWTAQDLKEKDAKSAVASSPMERFLIRICLTGSGTLAPTPYELTSLV